jgi:hypothetical protein
MLTFSSRLLVPQASEMMKNMDPDTMAKMLQAQVRD